jgi:hypothetical protein
VTSLLRWCDALFDVGTIPIDADYDFSTQTLFDLTIKRFRPVHPLAINR